MTSPTVETTDLIADDTKVCPFCAETIKAAANVCRYCGRDLLPEKATKIKKPVSIGKQIFSGITLTILLLGGIYLLYAVMYNIDRWSSASTMPPVPTLTATQIRDQAITISYDDLARNTEDYVGKIVHFKGNVLQVMGDPQSDDGAQLRVSVDGIGNVVYLFYDSGPRVLVGDIIDFYATVDGRLTYEAILGNQVTLPAATVNLLTVD